MTNRDRQEATAVVRRLLATVERGEIEADTPAARRLLRRLEGAAAAWEVEIKRDPGPGSRPFRS